MSSINDKNNSYQQYNGSEIKYNHKATLDPINLNFNSFKKGENKQVNGGLKLFSGKQPINSIPSNPTTNSTTNYQYPTSLNVFNQQAQQSYTSLGNNNFTSNINNLNYSSSNNKNPTNCSNYKPSFLTENNSLKPTQIY